MRTRLRSRGFILIPVVVAIAVIGALAFVAANQSAIDTSSVNRELAAAQAEYTAQAGLQHAIHQAGEQGCGPFTDLASVAIGDASYTTALTTDLGTTASYTIAVDQDGWIRSDNTAKTHPTDTALEFRADNKTYRPVYRYDLSAIPTNTPILAATAYFHVSSAHPEGPIDIHLLTAAWTEDNANWDRLGDAMDAGVQATIPTQPDADVWVAVNLTSAVQGWVNGQGNYGITLNSRGDGAHGDYASREAGSDAPYLTVITGAPPSADADLKAVGTLADGTARTLQRDIRLRQAAPGVAHLQPDGSSGKDAEIFDQQPDDNYGDANVTWVSSASNDKTRTLLRFDTGRIPFGASVLQATLSLQRKSGSGGGPVSAHRMTREWNEGQVTWNRYESWRNWTSPGGDFDSRPVTTTQVGTTDQRYEWDLSTLVQGWVDGSFPNHGLILVPAEDGMPGEEFYTSDDSDPTRHPRLTVTYRCDCGVACRVPQGNGGRIVMIGNYVGLTADPRDLEKEAIFESWGYSVDVADDNFLWLINFDNYDLVYVSGTADSSALTGQLDYRSIGIVNELAGLNPDFGFYTTDNAKTGTAITIVDNSHYITAPLPAGPVAIYDADMEITVGSGTTASGSTTLARFGGDASLIVLNAGDTTTKGTAAGRRVALPLGRATDANFDWTHLNNNGRLLVQRALEWASGGGTARGSILLVVDKDDDLTDQEAARQALFESWNYLVNVIAADADQADFDDAVAINDLVYIGEDITAGDLGSKLVAADIGVITEEADLADEFGFHDGTPAWSSGTEMDIQPFHYIGNAQPADSDSILTTSESLVRLQGNLAPGIIAVGYIGEDVSLAALDTGAALIGGGSAAGRRVLLPWGGDTMDIENLDANGLAILRRALEWASGAELDLGLVAHWELDDASGTNAIDREGGHDGTLQNGPEWGSGMRSGGLAFDGADDAVVVAHDDGLSLTDAMSFTAWVRADAFSVGGPYSLVVSKGTVATSYAYYFGTQGDEIIFGFSADGAWREFVTTNLDLATDAWHHIAATFDSASGQVTLYHEGVEVLSTTTTYAPSATTHDLYIGSSEDGADWDGSLDDVRIYDRALNAAEVAWLAERPGPIAHWKLDETSGETASDSANDHDGTLDNGAAWTTGQLDNAVSFDGLNDRIDVAADEALDLQAALTISAWVNSDDLDGYRMVLTKGDNGEPENYWLGLEEDRINFGFDDGGGWVQHTSSGLTLEAGRWQHVVATFDNTTNRVTLYLDGVAETFTNTSTPTTNDEGLIIGDSFFFGEAFDGSIDDVRLYDRALNASEVQALYDAGSGAVGAGVEVGAGALLDGETIELGGCNGTYLDRFDARDWDGSNGTLDWSSSPWSEVGESDGAGSGDVQILNDTSNYQLRIRDNDNGGEGVERVADLSGARSATLSLRYRRSELDSSFDYVAIYASSSGTGGPWTELPGPRIQGGDNDASYQSWSRDISAYISANTAIRLRSSSTMGGTDTVWFDNIQIQCN